MWTMFKLWSIAFSCIKLIIFLLILPIVGTIPQAHWSMIHANLRALRWHSQLYVISTGYLLTTRRVKECSLEELFILHNMNTLKLMHVGSLLVAVPVCKRKNKKSKAIYLGPYMWYLIRLVWALDVFNILLIMWVEC